LKYQSLGFLSRGKQWRWSGSWSRRWRLYS